MSCLVMISINDRGNLGARQIVAQFKRAGHEAFLVNFGEYKHDTYEFSESPGSCLGGLRRLHGLLHDLRPDVIGISYRSAMADLAETVGRTFYLMPDAVIVAGGIGATSEPGRARRWADHVWIGEGETFVDVAFDLPRMFHPAKFVPGAVHPAAKLTEHLDDVPFPDYTAETTWTIVRGEVIHPDGRLDNDLGAYPLLTSRGCPRACTYCHNSTVHELYRGQTYARQRSVGHVMDELAWALLRWDVKLLSIYDNLFVADPEWVMEFCQRLPGVWPRSRTAQVPTMGGGPQVRTMTEPRPPRFWCMAHPNYIRHTDVECLVHVGLEELCLGVQSGSERILDLYHRGTTLAQIYSACEILRRFPVLAVKIDIISANPLETDEDIRATMAMLQALPKTPKWHPGLSRLTVFPGSAIENQVTAAQCEALHGPKQDFIDGLYRAAFVPRWYETNLVGAIGRYADFENWSRGRDWPADKGPISDEHWAPLSAWLDAGAPKFQRKGGTDERIHTGSMES